MPQENWQDIKSYQKSQKINHVKSLAVHERTIIGITSLICLVLVGGLSKWMNNSIKSHVGTDAIYGYGYYGRGGGVSYVDPVTEADKKAETEARKRSLETFPVQIDIRGVSYRVMSR